MAELNTLSPVFMVLSAVDAPLLMFCCRQANDFYILLIGEKGLGKSNLLNMCINFYRGTLKSRTALPGVKELKLVVPTKWLKTTEPEGKQHLERDATDRELLLSIHHHHLCSVAGASML